MCSGDHGYIVYFSDVNTFWLVSGNKLLQLGDCVHVYNLGIQSKYSHMYMLHNGLSAYQCKVALLQVVGGAYNISVLLVLLCSHCTLYTMARQCICITLSTHVPLLHLFLHLTVSINSCAPLEVDNYRSKVWLDCPAEYFENCCHFITDHTMACISCMRI